MTDRSRGGGDAGFTLVEVIVALGLLVVALVALAHLLALATRANLGGRRATTAAVLAGEKMEQLRGLAWTVDARGAPVSDLTTDVAAFEAAPGCAGGRGGAAVGLSPSSADTLARSTDGYVDYVDANGCGLGGGSTPPPGTVYVRRWSIEPLPVSPGDTLVLQVSVTRRFDGGAGVADGSGRRTPDGARLVSVRTRKTP